MNPELQRNLWLEAGRRRALWLAVVLGLIYGAVFLTTNDDPAERARAGYAIVGGLVVVAAGLIWGARAAASSLLTEVAERTWEFQRLSSLTPWEMTVGKLFGATALAWAAAATGALALFNAQAHEDGLGDAVWMVAGLAASLLLFHAIALAGALVGVRKGRVDGRAIVPRGALGSLFAAGLLLTSLGRALPLGSIFGGGGRDLSGRVEWWGQSFDGSPFIALSIAAFAAWAVTGAWRLMRLELQLRNQPWVWAGFLLFAGVYAAGFPTGADERWLAAGLVMALAAYVTAFSEPMDRVRFRQWLAALRDGARDTALSFSPAALWALAAAAVCVLAAVAAGLDEGRSDGRGVALASLAFLARDIGVIALCRLSQRARRGDFGAVVVLALLYGVGAMLAAPLMTPFHDEPLTALVSAALQAAGAWYLVARAIRAPDPEPAVAAP